MCCNSRLRICPCPQESKDGLVDCGVTLHAKLDWEIADMLLPAQLPEIKALHTYAVAEGLVPSGWGMSLFPESPEIRLCFEMDLESGSTYADYGRLVNVMSSIWRSH